LLIFEISRNRGELRARQRLIVEEITKDGFLLEVDKEFKRSEARATSPTLSCRRRAGTPLTPCGKWKKVGARTSASGTLERRTGGGYGPACERLQKGPRAVSIKDIKILGSWKEAEKVSLGFARHSSLLCEDGEEED